MVHNILLTGASGYLGGTLLARWKSANLPAHGKLYALVRTDAQAEAVKQYGAEPVSLDLKSEASLRSFVLDNEISVVYWLIDPVNFEPQVNLMKAMAEVKQKTGKAVHLLHTTGAKVFSSHAGTPTDRPIYDTDPQVYEIQKAQKSFSWMQGAINANNAITEQAEELGVRSYIFAPCIVYGKGEGFGNPISIQTVAIIQAAKALKRVYRVDSGRPTWPVCHVLDNTSLYLDILRKILADENPSHGKQGYYLASPGSVAWDDIYEAIAKAMAKRNVVDDATVIDADDQTMERMGTALGCSKEMVPVMVGGRCTYTAQRGVKELGWKPQYPPEHILEAADEEVELVLKNLKD
ncbi:hypothetical protein F4780DRAFT_346588 [Xylariomycetidae sp. FL0641]|nr:hypothetical protein F4780DRAFT_346588 [Xylariomycetidae sp. FL0641]